MNWRIWIGAGFVLAGILFGGGGSSAPFSELLTELIAIAAAAAYLTSPGRLDTRPLPRSAVVLGMLMLLLPVVQLIPLPPSLWQSLPGRDAERASLALIGAAGHWMPWSIAPALTWASLLSLLPPLVALAFASRAGPEGRTALIAAVALGGVVSMMLGALQLADGAGRTWRFYVDNPGFLNGFQANRNAEVDVLLIAAMAVAAVTSLLARSAKAPARIGGVALCMALLLGCLMTGSRTGILIAAPVSAAAAMTLEPRLRRKRAIAVLLAISLVPLAALMLAVPLGNQALLQVAGRFTLSRDMRIDLWRDSWAAMRVHWPWGSGVGTFRPAFLPSERLLVVSPGYPVRVHDDYLEFLLEGGIFAAGILLASIALVTRGIVQACRTTRAADVPQLIFAVTTLAVVCMHSFVDYPLRSMALSILTATAVGIILGVAGELRRSAGGRL